MKARASLLAQRLGSSEAGRAGWPDLVAGW